MVEKNDYYSFVWGAYGLQPDFEIKIGDIDGNGKNNIVVLNRRGLLIVYEWTGKHYLPIHKIFIGRKFDKLHLADINGDGILDIVVAGKKSLLIYGFKNCSLILIAKQIFSGHITSLAVGDIDNDCISEIAVSIGGQKIKIYKFCNNNLILLDKINISHPALVKIRDVLGNGNQLVVLEISSSIGRDIIYIYDIQNGKLNHIKQIKIPYKVSYSNILNLFKLSRGNSKIVISVKQDRKILIMDYTKGYFKDCLISGYFSDLIDIASGDWDGDGYNELIIADGNKIYIYKWDGMTYVRKRIIESYRKIKALAVGDIDNDGLDEIIVGTVNGELIIIRDTFKSKSQFIVNQDVTLPEEYPDIIKVSDAKISSICILEKKVICNKVIIKGYFDVTVLYVAEPDRSVRALDVKVSFLHVIQIPGLMPGDRVFADVQVEYASARFDPADKREIEVVIIAKVIAFDITIGHNQSLHEVANSYGVKINDLASINDLDENMMLNKGDKIKLPPKS